MNVGRVVVVIVGFALAVAAVFVAFRALDERAAPPIVIEDAAATRPVVVDVRGAVLAPGMLELPPGARVQDAIAAAGGLAADADLSTINLARRLRDGEIVIIAAVPEPGTPSAAAGTFDTPSSGDAPTININTATAAELDQLPGIGEVIAARIVEFRQEHGPYRSANDLIHVDGVSQRMVDELRDLVTTGP